MAVTNTTLATSATRVFLASGQQAVTTVIFCNVSASTNATVYVYAVPSGGTVGVGNMIANSVSIPATETFVFDTERFVLDSGDALWATASTSSCIVATVSALGTS